MHVTPTTIHAEQVVALRREADAGDLDAWLRLADLHELVGDRELARDTLLQPPASAGPGPQARALVRLALLETAPSARVRFAQGLLASGKAHDAPETLVAMAAALEGTRNRAALATRRALLERLAMDLDPFWSVRARHQLALLDAQIGSTEHAVDRLRGVINDAADDELKAESLLDLSVMLEDWTPREGTSVLNEAISASQAAMDLRTALAPRAARRAAALTERVGDYEAAERRWAEARQLAWGPDGRAAGIARDFAVVVWSGSGRWRQRDPESATSSYGTLPPGYRLAPLNLDTNSGDGFALGALAQPIPEEAAAFVLLDGHGSPLMIGRQSVAHEIADALNLLEVAACSNGRMAALEKSVAILDLALGQPRRSLTELRLLVERFLRHADAPEALRRRMLPWPLIAEGIAALARCFEPHHPRDRKRAVAALPDLDIRDSMYEAAPGLWPASQRVASQLSAAGRVTSPAASALTAAIRKLPRESLPPWTRPYLVALSRALNDALTHQSQNPSHVMPRPDSGADLPIDPFGEPDASRVDLHPGHDPLSHFIDFTASDTGRGVGMHADDRTVRVIVGKKGSGKTLYLRRLQQAAAQEPSLHAEPLELTYALTDEIVRVTQLYDYSIASEKWQALWRAAILATLANHLLTDPRLDDVHRQHLKPLYQTLGPGFGARVPISEHLRSIIVHYADAARLDSYLRSPRWAELHVRVADALPDIPPICFYLDTIDDEFKRAPMFWLMCQRALFYQVFRFLRDPRLGGRVHVTIAVRDLVLLNIRQSEHATRYREGLYIRELTWNKPLIRAFIGKKLQTLPNGYMANPDAGPTLQGWLGARTIRNRQGVEEDVEDYLLRHTRLIPRDVVIIGNEIAKAQKAARSGLTNTEIRQVVGRAARDFGDEQLAIAANHISSDLMPQDAGRLGFGGVYLGPSQERFEGDDAYQRSLSTRLKALIREAGYNRLTRAQFEIFRTKAFEALDGHSDVATVLWLNGLIGYIDGANVSTGSVVFWDQEGRLELPEGRCGYAFHAIFLDAIDGLKAVGKPVG